MNRLVVEQLKELAGHLDWTMLQVKDEDDQTVMVVLGEDSWVDEFFGDSLAD